MILAGISVCVDFDDYFRHTLPCNRRHVDTYLVVTDRDRPELRRLCEAHDVQLIESARFFEGGAAFNKGSGINDGLRMVDADWLLHLDADVVLPASFRWDLDRLELNPQALYGCGRLLCPSYAAWQRYRVSGLYGCGWEESPPFRYVPTFRQLWDPAEVEAPPTRLLPLGFFQLFSRSAECLRTGPVYPEDSSTAGGSDLAFALKFRQIRFLDGIKVIHLPSSEESADGNWEGRRSKPFPEVEAKTIVVNSLAPALAKAQDGADGPFVRFFHNGSVAEEGLFCGGLAHGRWTERRENGSIDGEGPYERGLPHGRWRRTSAGGRLIAEQAYRKGRMHGPFTVWHASGQLAARGRYRGGRLHGLIEEWYASGARALAGTYRRGQKHGRFRAWHASGGEALDMSYRDDQPHGPYVLYYEDGRPMVRGSYWHGARHGWFVSWYQTGQKAAQTEFCNGRQVGDHAAWPILDEQDAALVPTTRYQSLAIVERVQPRETGRLHHAKSATAVAAGSQRPRRRACVARLAHACVGFEGLVFDCDRLFLIDPIYRLSFEQLCSTTRGFRLLGRSARVSARLDIRWPSSWPERPIHPHPRHRRTARPDAAPFVERFAALTSIVHRHGGSYYHWLLESFPRLLQLRHLLASEPDVLVLIDYDFGGSFANTWTDQYLELIGVDASRVVRYDPSRIYAADRLYVPVPVSSGRPHAEPLQAIRRALLPAPARTGPSVMVAVNRTNAACRRVRNWPAVVSALQRIACVEVIDFNSDEWRVRDQIDLFSRAVAVVGAHGAGLANMVFCQPGTSIAELVPADHAGGACFADEAAALGLSHRYHRGTVAGLHDDFELPIEPFIAAISGQLDAPGRRASGPTRWS